MDEDKTLHSKKAGGSSPRRRRASHRAQHWATQRNGHGNWPPQESSQNSATHSIAQNRDSVENGLHPLRNSSSDIDLSTSGSSNVLHGLNDIHQLLEGLDSDFSGNASERAGYSENITETVSNSGSGDNRNFIPSQLRPMPARLRARRRITRTTDSSRSDEADITGRSGRNTSQSRHYLASGQRVPVHIPNRMSSFSSSSPDQGASSGYYTLFGPMGSPNTYLDSITSGLGTQEEPYELLTELPDVTNSPTVLRDRNSMLSDEEIARQLQQEEWEAAGSFGGETIPHALRDSMFHYPFQRSRPTDLSPVRGRGRGMASGGQGYPLLSRFYGNRGGNRGVLGLRPPGRSSRGRGGAANVRDALDILMFQLDDADVDLGFLVDLLSSYGFSLMEIQGMLDPGPVGSRPGLDLDNYESLLALAEELGEVSRGISQSDINRIPTSKHKASSSEREAAAAAVGASHNEPVQCHICLSEYETGDEKRILQCKHDFHKHCVDQWLRTNATCPVCRSDVKPKKS